MTTDSPALETAAGRVTFPRVLLSEWTKFRSVRSTKWSLGVAILLTVAFPLIPAFVTKHQFDQGQNIGGGSPLDVALIGILIAQLAIAILGVLVITAEYSTGSIRSTFTAVPKRLPVLWAKLIDYALVTIAVMVPAVLVSFFETQAILRGIPRFDASFTAPGIARCLLMAPVYVMLVGIFALALGAIIRSTAGSIAAFAAIFFVVPPLTHALPQSWQNATTKYLPSEAGRQITSLHHGSDTLAPLAGGLVFAGYCALAIAIAAVLLRRRDV